MTFARSSLFSVALVALVGTTGLLVARGDELGAAAVASTPLLALFVMRAHAIVARQPSALVIASAVWVMAIASAFVWRGRSTTQLYADPLDGAALVRVALIAATLWLAAATIVQFGIPRRVPLPLRLLAGYAAVACVAALTSPHLLNAGYRVVEVIAGVVAAIAAMTLLGRNAGRMMLRVSMDVVTILVLVIWAEAILLPGRAWIRTLGNIPYTLNGYMPSFSSNTVGVFGGLLALWSLAQLLGRRSGSAARSWSLLPPGLGLFLGVATLVASQYRTGFIGVAAGTIALLLVQRRYRLVLMLGLALAVAVAYLGVNQVESKATQAFEKGQPELLHTLNSRTVYWHAAFHLVEQRPLAGWGLNVGGRQALVAIGDDETGGVHGTWPQALVDTGILGALFLLGAFVSALVIAARAAFAAPQNARAAAVLAMLIFLAVRSLTGPTIDSFNELFPVFLALVLAAAAARDSAGAPRRT